MIPIPGPMIPVPGPVPAPPRGLAPDPAVSFLPAVVDLAARLLVHSARVARGLDAVAAELALGRIAKGAAPRGGRPGVPCVVVPVLEVVVLHHGGALPRRGLLRLVRRALLPRQPVQAQQRATGRGLGRRGGENMLLLRVLRLVDELGGLSLGRHPAKSD